ncbi:hypothetical protein Mal52_50100 [Symmachiella dynata]|uniref:Uncharacterized protein n=1 Tax=Symmachiella dynata TaxID=2527995 RepID=A0A517ZVL0_9PLAN|nr:hypothetical protein [Symmachiella dynata]QDU46489.1 hypothetical protein Mal52_50100 [Symmachiella dynata]
MNIRQVITTAAIFCCLLVGTTNIATAAPLRSFTVQQFNKVFEKFVGLDVRVIGRKSLASTREIGLLHCEVRFKSRRLMEKLSRDVAKVQIDGRVVREGNRYVVYISAVKTLPSDEEEFQLRKRRLNEKSLEGWYELGEWATGQGTFYQDDKMSMLGREAHAQGIAIERAAARGKDAVRLKKLAAKAETYGLLPALQENLLFEAFVLMRDQAKSVADLGVAISEAATELPGSEIPLPQPQPKLRKQYKADPQTSYEGASATQRTLLHRILMSDLILARLQDQLDKNFENGFQIADLIDREIPEFRDLAQEYRDQSLKARTEQVATLSRADILDLQKHYDDQQQPDKGREVVEAWLEHRRNRLDEQDTEGLLNLSEEYVTMLNRPERATDLLLTAAERNPGNERIEAKLGRLGYQLQNGKWRAPRGGDEQDESDIERAMREGRPVLKMTATQLRKAMASEPAKILRIASQGQVDEFWLYGDSTGSQLAVRLSRRDGSPEAKVTAIGQVKLTP